MNEQEIYEIGYKAMCKEITEVTEQVQKEGTMSDKNLDRLDKLYHLKKEMLTTKAMLDAEDYEKDGFSGRRGRGSDGRYISRNGNNGGESYTEGYSDGYSEAMNQMKTSGHYPMMDYQNYPTRRW